MGPEGSLPHLQEAVTCPILNQIDPVHVPHPTSGRPIFILSSHLRLGLQSTSAVNKLMNSRFFIKYWEVL
jgi:hypothetical protein